MKALVLLLVGLLLIVVNELTKSNTTNVVVKYIPRDLDAWFKDPENQPMFMYSDALFGDNIRM